MLETASKVDTCVILIGNSDNKLTQQEWHSFVIDIKNLIWVLEKETHFIGSSEPFSEYQSACFVLTCLQENIEQLKLRLKQIKKRYNQNFIAFIQTDTEML